MEPKELRSRWPSGTRTRNGDGSMFFTRRRLLHYSLGLFRSTLVYFYQAFNLGQIDTQKFTVSKVLNLLSGEIPFVQILTHLADLTESGKLWLNNNLAIGPISWEPRRNNRQVIEQKAYWYKAVFVRKDSAYQVCKNHILN